MKKKTPRLKYNEKQRKTLMLKQENQRNLEMLKAAEHFEPTDANGDVDSEMFVPKPVAKQEMVETATKRRVKNTDLSLLMSPDFALLMSMMGMLNTTTDSPSKTKNKNHKDGKLS